MKPIEFEGHNTVYAKDQPQYQPLPTLQQGGFVISCWQLSLRERFKILWTGQLWLTMMTFGQPLQPQLPEVDRPFNIVKK